MLIGDIAKFGCGLRAKCGEKSKYIGFARFCTLDFLAVWAFLENFEAVKPKNKTYEVH